MSVKFWVDGRCHLCTVHTLVRCDGCGKFTCTSHTKSVKQGNAKIDICKKCVKGVKPGSKVGGVKISAKALEG